jgi:UDP-N-acetyl-D-mannosaminuronic acid dehydrogenase
MNTVAAGIRTDEAVPTVAVYGLGKMGLPLAAVMADAGYEVIGVDIDEAITAAVNRGESPIDEPGIGELVNQHSGSGLKATTDGQSAAERSDVMVILVPTVLDDHDNPDLEPVLSVADDIRQGLSSGNLVILESTVPPKTTEGELVAALESDGLEAGTDFGLAHCPERTYAGRVIEDLTESYPKIVGGIDKDSTAAAAALYQRFNEQGVIELGSATAAEAVKVFEGIYRDTNIALANELAKVCEGWGLDANEVFDAANSQPFSDIHTPGIGVGGHCIPVYPHFVIDGPVDTPLIEESRAINDSMPGHAVGLLKEKLSGHGRSIANSNVLVLGLTYRAGVDELRYAPALDVIEQLHQEGASVYAHDPLVDDDTISKAGATPRQATDANDLDGIILATAHDQYTELDIDTIGASMRTPVFIDGRAAFSREDMGPFTYAQIGNGLTDT